MLVERAEPPREVDTLRFRFMPRIRFLDLLIERLAGERHPALLFQRNRDAFVLDQVAITFRLRPPAGFHRRARGRVLTEPHRLRIGRIDFAELVVNLDRLLAFSQFVIKPAQLMKNF